MQALLYMSLVCLSSSMSLLISDSTPSYQDHCKSKFNTVKCELFLHVLLLLHKCMSRSNDINVSSVIHLTMFCGDHDISLSIDEKSLLAKPMSMYLVPEYDDVELLLSVLDLPLLLTNDISLSRDSSCVLFIEAFPLENGDLYQILG